MKRRSCHLLSLRRREARTTKMSETIEWECNKCPDDGCLAIELAADCFDCGSSNTNIHAPEYGKIVFKCRDCGFRESVGHGLY